MTQPPPPAGTSEDEPARLVDAATGEPLPVADMRGEFARLSRDADNSPESERAFIEGKIGLITGDPRLSDEEKRAAIAELLERSRGDS
jgi:hypothetical protein